MPCFFCGSTYANIFMCHHFSVCALHYIAAMNTRVIENGSIKLSPNAAVIWTCPQGCIRSPKIHYPTSSQFVDCGLCNKRFTEVYFAQHALNGCNALVKCGQCFQTYNSDSLHKHLEEDCKWFKGITCLYNLKTKINK